MKCPICLEEMVYDAAQQEWICPGESSEIKQERDNHSLKRSLDNTLNNLKILKDSYNKAFNNNTNNG